jgi:hypothetical protein
MEIAAIRRKATPVNNLSFVMNHTIMAIIAAGSKKNKTFAMNNIIRTPIIRRINRTASSRSEGRGRKGNTTPPISLIV